jgi:hypothetical protein
MVDSYIQNPVDGTGKKIRTDEQTIGANLVHTAYVKMDEPATFRAIFDRIVPAVNKHVAVLFNSSATRKVVIHKVFVYNWQAAAVTGTIIEYEWKRITTLVGGTAVTPISNDTADTLSAGITAVHTPTSATEGALLKRGFTSGEEVKIGACTLESNNALRQGALFYEKSAGIKGIVLRQNQGITVKVISGTVGTISVIILFTDEPV